MKKFFEKHFFWILLCTVGAIPVIAGVVQSAWTITSDATIARDALAAAANNNLVCTNATNFGALTVKGNALYQSNATYVGTAQFQSNVSYQRALVGFHWDMDTNGNFNTDGSGSFGGDLRVYGTLYAAIHTIKFIDVVTNESNEVITNEYPGLSFDTNNNRMKLNTNAVFEGSTTFAGDVFHENLAGLQDRIVKVDNAGQEGGINLSLNDGDVLSGNGTFQPMYGTNINGPLQRVYFANENSAGLTVNNLTETQINSLLPMDFGTVYLNTTSNVLEYIKDDGGGGNQRVQIGAGTTSGDPFTNSPTIITNIPAFEEMVTNGSTIAFVIANIELNNGADGSSAHTTFHAWLDSTNNFANQIGSEGNSSQNTVTFSYLLSPGEIFWFSDESVDPSTASIASVVLKQFP